VYVVSAEVMCSGRDAKDHPTARPSESRPLANRTHIVLDVLQDLKGAHGIKSLFRLVVLGGNVEQATCSIKRRASDPERLGIGLETHVIEVTSNERAEGSSTDPDLNEFPHIRGEKAPYNAITKPAADCQRGHL
jgi:hypothetical protein